jgi:hypothetical protein
MVFEIVFNGSKVNSEQAMERTECTIRCFAFFIRLKTGVSSAQIRLAALGIHFSCVFAGKLNV